MADENGRQVVVITGASAGVGRALARAYGRRGAAVGLIARGMDGLEGARRDVEHAGGRALILQADVADAAAVEAAADRAERELGPIDLWINDAMTSVFAPVKDLTADEVGRVTQVTYLGAVHGAMAALRRMLPRDRGVILMVGSALAFRGIPLQAAYCGAKHAMQGFTESLRTELLHDGSNVKVVMAQLPAVNTPQFGWVRSKLPHRAQPVPPIFQPELIASGIMYLADHPNRQSMEIGYPTVQAVWGNRFAPRFSDWVLARSGYSAQQTDEPEDPDRPDNLYAPVAGDHGAHGRFDRRARDSSLQLWLNTHRVSVLTGLLGAAAVAGAFIRRR
jgi:NAD(P)-dependent dehydrogenase (short-subunit alcohol dehydrogenase family)